MAKRFMDNSIFEKQWFRELPVRLKVVWFYLINKCDHAGILNDLDIGLLSYQIGDNYTIDEILEAFKGNIEQIGESKFFLNKFCKFQYGELNPSVRVHQSVIKLLKKHNIELDNPLVSVKDKDKDISKDIKTRKKEFAERVDKEIVGMGVNPQLQKEFIDYWSEHNDGGKVMRYEQQSIFNIKRRMATWIKNSKKFNNTFQPTEEDVAEKEAKVQADYEAQQRRLREADDNVATDDDRKKALGLK